MFGTREFRFSYTDETGELRYVMARNQWLAQRALQDRGVKFSNLKRAPFEKVKPLTTGTCQICGREIGTTMGVIAHHGYTRPGHGWQTSSCWGAKHVAYEVGHDALDSLIPVIQAQLSLHTEQLADWLANPPATITFTKDGSYNFQTRKYNKIEVTVERPADFDPKAEVDSYFGRENYACQYDARRHAMEQNVKNDQQDLAHFTQRRADWKEPK
jgi:hypothetical protein